MRRLTIDSAPIVPMRRRKDPYSLHPFGLTFCVLAIVLLANWGLETSKHGVAAFLGRKPPEIVLPSAQILIRNNERECRYAPYVKDQCAFVRENCPDEDGLISYLQLYYCMLPNAKPVAFIILILWLAVLFSTIGIAASDFLCINLSTLARVLGMSESLTGVTFLAFGNGSPDVFSTFAAMSSNSGSLAVGELIGAACFITAVVAGSMALVRPFRVARRSFVRDVGYFVIAGGFSIVFLADGTLHVWECATMVGLYIFYVVMVVGWHWYRTRWRRYEIGRETGAPTLLPEPQYLGTEVDNAEDDLAGETRSFLHSSTGEVDAAQEPESWPAWNDDEDKKTSDHYLASIQDGMHVRRSSATRGRSTLSSIRPSLVGALEFRSVLSSLRRSSNFSDQLSDSRHSPERNSARSHHRDNLSIYSNPLEHTERLSFEHPSGAARVRSVSMNDALEVRFNPSVVNDERRTLLGVNPDAKLGSTETVDTTFSPRPRLLSCESPAIRSSLPSSEVPSRDQSVTPAGRLQLPGHLAVPTDNFHSFERDRSLSPRAAAQVSPLEIPQISISSPQDTWSTSMPLVTSPDSFVPMSPRVPSVSLPLMSVGQESTRVNDEAMEGTSPKLRRLQWWPYWLLPSPWLLMSTLFPTLCNWERKNHWEKLLGIVAFPSVFILTITIPVVEPIGIDSTSNTEADQPLLTDRDEIHQSPRIRLPEDAPPFLPEDIESSNRSHGATHPSEQQGCASSPLTESDLSIIHNSTQAPFPSAKEWNQWLISIQLFSAPFLIILLGSLNMDVKSNPGRLFLLAMVCLLFSTVCMTLLNLALRVKTPSQPPNQIRFFLAFIGFTVGVCWIATIANEVVSVLKTLGVIFNISDSLLGLTVFAVGNSLGDLVADITVARLGYPVMALSACFGGPMLNILLGIGVGGLYMTLRPKSSMVNGSLAASYKIEISKTLAISGATLLIILIGLLVAVPLNRWTMDRKIGWGLIAVWIISTAGSVVTEIMNT